MSTRIERSVALAQRDQFKSVALPQRDQFTSVALAQRDQLTLPAEIAACIAGLAEEWEEQSRTLHWVFRDLGGDPARLLGESPFRSPAAARGRGLRRPAGALGV